ncbi:MAG: hypothetical protein RIC80_07960 [Cyclobacteriaceae bacterium]
MNQSTKIRLSIMLLIASLVFQSCATTKVTNYWKNDQASMEDFKQQKIFVIARTNSNLTRATLEQEIVMQLAKDGIEGLASYQKFPQLNPEEEMTKERTAQIKEILENDGFGGVIMVSVKDKKETTTTTQNGGYMGAGYNAYYPGRYGGFYNYYRQPYYYGSYYSSFPSYVPGTSTTSTSTTYVLETVAYNMTAPDDQKLVFVVFSDIKDPNNVDKAAQSYVDTIVQKLSQN